MPFHHRLFWTSLISEQKTLPECLATFHLAQKVNSWRSKHNVNYLLSIGKSNIYIYKIYFVVPLYSLQEIGHCIQWHHEKQRKAYSVKMPKCGYRSYHIQGIKIYWNVI
jgi:hypothetical protein